MDSLESENKKLKALITELCDALEWYVPLSLTPADQDLIQHAREVTR